MCSVSMGSFTRSERTIRLLFGVVMSRVNFGRLVCKSFRAIMELGVRCTHVTNFIFDVHLR